MGQNIFAAKHFHDEEAARAWFEAARWPQGPYCPKCGCTEPYKTKKLGVYRCRAKECRRDFTVTTGSVMERSHCKLTQWATGFWLAASSKKGFSAHQLHRAIGCQYNTAWFMHHRIMEAMTVASGSEPPLGGHGKVVEADETYIGKKAGKRKKAGAGGYAHKQTVLSIAERGGKVRSFKIGGSAKGDIVPLLHKNIDLNSTLHTDGASQYRDVWMIAGHESVDHNKEYVRQGKTGPVHTNTLEGFFSVFKRGMVGTYQHCHERYLPRYLAEFDFRHNYRESLGYSDMQRTIAAVKSGVGKRIMYRQAAAAK